MEISERIRTVLPKMPGRSGDNSIVELWKHDIEAGKL
jgi:hypothetical protein